jgi:hypothetical protein
MTVLRTAGMVALTATEDGDLGVERFGPLEDDRAVHRHHLVVATWAFASLDPVPRLVPELPAPRVDGGDPRVVGLLGVRKLARHALRSLHQSLCSPAWGELRSRLGHPEQSAKNPTMAVRTSTLGDHGRS